jgi:hypothetical protein
MVNEMDRYAGDFSLATSVEGHPSGTLAHVSVSARHPTRVTLDFSDRHPALTDATVLLSGDTGAVKLRELGYTGPLTKRPRLAEP